MGGDWIQDITYLAERDLTHLCTSHDAIFPGG